MQTSRTILGVYGANTPKVLQTYKITVGSGSTPIVPVDPSSGAISASYAARTSLIFHNPGTTDVYIAMAFDHLGNTIVPTVGGPGTVLIMAASTLVVDSPGVGAWNAVSATGGSLTVLEYLS